VKRYGNLWDQLVSWPNLLLAARKAQRGKRDRPAVRRFNFLQEFQLYRLAGELADGSYAPGPFRSHWITVPKPRMISAAPYRDRVVHHALMNVLEPILDRHFHPHSFACRAGKGTHAAADRLQQLMRGNRYVLQCDVRKFFPSIDHSILKAKFRRLIKDRRVLSLMDRIVDHSNPQEPVMEWFPGDSLWTPIERRRGLPIGNLTSQWFANWMLNDVDHLITSEMEIGAYVRYCDDFLVLGNDREELKAAANVIGQRLAMDRLSLHEGRLAVAPVSAGLRFVGYRIWPTHRALRKENVRRFRRRVRWMRRAYAQRRIDWDSVRPRLTSWLGHASTADSRALVRRVGREWVFTRERFLRGKAENVAGSSRRFVEQQTHELPLRVPQQEHARQPEQQQRVPGLPALPIRGWSRS
jgi:hypothetical protein